MFWESEDSEEEVPLSPLMQAILPKLAACSFREYQPEDLDDCLEVYLSNGGRKAEALRGFLELGSTYLLVMEYGGDLIGFGGLELVGDADNAWLVQGQVHAEFQRRGFGTSLLAARLALLETDERPLEVWTEVPIEVAPFFERLGFIDERFAKGLPSKRKRLSLIIEPQDILDIRDALLEREIRIGLDTEDEDG